MNSKIFDEIIKNGISKEMKPTEPKSYLFNVKVFYSKGGHKYANLFDKTMYDMGIELGTITGYRKMNRLEKFIFRNCL